MLNDISISKVIAWILPAATTIATRLDSIDSSIRSMYGRIIEFRAEVKKEIKSLREDLNCLKGSVSNLSVCLQEHKKQTETELADLHTSLASTQTNFTTSQLAQLQTSLDSTQTNFTSQLDMLQTSLNSTHSKLDSLTVTTAQLSSDHQQIQANISDVECLDTEQSLKLQPNLQNNLTHQLEKIQDDVTNILGAYTCGWTGGWRRVVYLDMTDPSTTCPSGWNMTGYSKRTCGRATDGTNICDSATFPVRGGEYTRICGRIRAYQWGGVDGFWNYHHGRVTTIDGAYVEGVSVTHGTPRNHIWTFAAGISEGNPTWSGSCPCDASIDIRVPSFIGDDYFCESGDNGRWIGKNIFYPNDTLWDGEDCLANTCCSRRNPPYFVKQLLNSTTDDIEARICLDEPSSNENIAVELVELYVQ